MKIIVFLMGILTSFQMAMADALLTTAPDPVEGNKLVSLDQLAWKNRLIVAKTSDFTTIEAIFKQHETAINERNIAWFLLNNSNLLSNHAHLSQSELTNEIAELLRPYKPDTFLLIGYDGEIKSRTSGLNIERIFELIDSMPMRQYEMANP